MTDTVKEEKKNEDCERKYNGWLVSDHFVKRALAVWFYYTIGYIFFLLILFLIIVFIKGLGTMITG